MYIPRYPTLWPKHLLFKIKKQMAPFPLNQENIVFYDRGRSAIHDSIRLLGISEGDKVLLPSYTCYDVVTPFVENRIKTEYYTINKDLSINKKDMEDRVKDRVKAVLFIHYFGFPQDLDFLKYIKEKYHIILMEDCAHSFLSKVNGMPLGSFGDVSIYSLRKIVPVHNVGILLVKSGFINELIHEPDIPQTVFKGILYRMLENIKFRSGIKFKAHNLNKLNNTINVKLPEINFINSSQKKGIANINKRILDGLNFEEIRSDRRSNFTVLLNWFKNTRRDIQPLFDNLPEGVCPMVFPVILKNRNSVSRLMNIDGIDVFPWPFLPKGIDGKDDVANYLAKNILLLPIHQDVGNNCLNYMINSLEKAIDISLREN